MAQKNNTAKIMVGIAIAFLLFTVSLNSASAATITVNASGGVADYSSIQAAINNANVGDVIEVQSGTYLENVVVNKTLTLKGIGMPLVNASGSGTAITIISGGSTVDGFNVTGSGTYWNGGDADSGIKIKSDNNSVLNSTSGFNNYGVYVFESENNTIENNNVYSNTEGIYVFYSSNNSIMNNTISTNINRGVIISNSNNCMISNNTVSENTDGIYLTTSTNCSLSDNIANSNSNNGIYLYPYSTGNTLTNNTASSNTQNGVYLASSDSNMLIDNTASSNTQNGVYLASSDSNVLIDNTASSNTQNGIYLASSDSNVLTDNIASSNTQNGIYLTSSDSNVLTDNTASSNTRNGIYLVSSSSNVLTDNIASSNTQNGIYLYRSDSIGPVGSPTRSNMLTDNAVINNKQNGIYLQNSNKQILRNNTALNNILTGIYLAFSDSNVLTDNIASNNTQNGIYLYASDVNTLIKNSALNNGYGFYITTSSISNTIFKNNLIENINYYNAYDTVGSNTWSYNHYSDYMGSDSDGGGIGDTAYYIAGDVGAKDMAPAMQPWNISDNSDSGANFTLYSGNNITLYEGYSLTLQQVNVDGNKAWITFEKDGVYIDDWILSSNDPFSYSRTIDSSSHLIFQGILDTVFRGVQTDLIKITYFYQFSEINGSILIENSNDLPNAAPSITLSSPSLASISDVEGDSRTFTAIVDQVADVTWILDGVTLQTNTSITTASYYNTSAKAGTHNLTVFTENANGTDQKKWTWTVTEPPAPSITLSSPSSSSVSNTEGDSRTFTAIVDQVADVTWILDGVTLQTNTSIITASYYNTSAKAGTHNLTVFTENANGTDQKKWTWSVDYVPVEEPVEEPVSETVVNTVYLRNQIINGSDITNNDMGYVGTTGNGILEINTSNFAGFYYNLNNNIGAENFKILQNLTVSYRTINKSGLVYTTSIIDSNYEQTLWTDSYQKICYFGEEYVPVKSNSANKLSKILIDEKDTHTIREGQSFKLGEGYAITPEQIDVNRNKVWFELTKDGLYVDNKIISVSGTNTVADKTWTYTQNIGGETDVETFRIHVDQVFQGQNDNLMVVKGIWQISDSILELDVNTTAGLMKVQEIDSKIKMINNESMTLSRGSTVDIANNMSIVVADSTTDIRFHLSKRYTTPGRYEVRGEVYNLSSSISGIIDYSNFAGLYYDLNTNLGTESLEINSISGRTISADSLIYTTVPKVTEFEYASWGAYNVTGFMGEKYFTGYPAGTFGITGSINLISNGQLSKILIDEDRSRAFYTGSGLILEGNYVLNIVEIDKNWDKVFVTLTKGGTELDSSIISSGSDYVYKKDLGSSNDVTIIAVHFKDIFQGVETNAVFVDGIFQISDQYKTVGTGDIYDKMKVTTIDANKIEMKNTNSITLTKNTIITIMDTFKFKVADDSNNVRFYPFTELIIESTPIEIVEYYEEEIKVGDGYQINNCVIDVTDIFISDKLAVFKVYQNGNNNPIYDKMIGINETLNFDLENGEVNLKLLSVGSGVLNRVNVLITVNNVDTYLTGIVNGGHAYATYTGNYYTMQLQKGWNLVSTPLTPDTPNVNKLFDSNSDVILPIYSWNTASKQYYDVSNIEISKGYWILALNDTQVTVTGTPYGG